MARSRQPYENLYEKIIKAVDKLNDGVTDINEVWTDRKEDETNDADI